MEIERERERVKERKREREKKSVTNTYKYIYRLCGKKDECGREPPRARKKCTDGERERQREGYRERETLKFYNLPIHLPLPHTKFYPYPIKNIFITYKKKFPFKNKKNFH